MFFLSGFLACSLLCRHSSSFLICSFLSLQSGWLGSFAIISSGSLWLATTLLGFGFFSINLFFVFCFLLSRLLGLFLISFIFLLGCCCFLGRSFTLWFLYYLCFFFFFFIISVRTMILLSILLMRIIIA